MRLIAFALSTFLLVPLAQAASFDCGKAVSNVEQLICNNQEISELDEKLNKAYRLALGKSEHKKAVTLDQVRWLNEMRDKCSDARCLKQVYAARIGKLSSSTAGQDTARTSLRHRLKRPLPNPGHGYEFSPFIKDRQFSDDPYEIASPEAEELLKFIEKQSLSEKTPAADKEIHLQWTKGFIAYLREGNGDFLKVSEGAYIVQSYFDNAYFSGIYLADMHVPVFKQLAAEYNLRVSESGTLKDGTGWLLASYRGLTQNRWIGGFFLITFFNSGGSTYVASEKPVGYAHDYETEGCEDNIEHEWKDINLDGQKELIFEVEDCTGTRTPNKVRSVFSISKGHISEL